MEKEKLLRMVDRMPTFSQNVVRILEITSDINAAPKDLVRLVEHDPILTIKVLKLVNSAYFGLSKKVTSIKQGVVYIGINTIKNLAVSIAAIGTLPRSNDADFDMDDFWYHSLVTATVAKLLAQHRGFPKAQVTGFFIAGLLHDIGQVVFAQFMPEDYREVLAQSRRSEGRLVDLERKAIGTCHTEVGAMLAEHWKLPREFVDSIRNHHDVAALGQAEPMDIAVFVANQVAKLQLEESQRLSDVEPVPNFVAEWLRIPIEELAGQLPNLSSEIENARSFIQIPMEVER